MPLLHSVDLVAAAFALAAVDVVVAAAAVAVAAVAEQDWILRYTQ